MNEPRIVVIIMIDGCSRSIGKRISVTPHLASIKDFLKSLCRPNLTFAGCIQLSGLFIIIIIINYKLYKKRAKD
jgi:hypothetical protein